ncbi:MAG: hypothetical protein KAJ98_02020, partial [Spirochaetaceae bacterium]|nr:hypothetical protein [Spirochaetaceae bacterium]
ITVSNFQENDAKKGIFDSRGLGRNISEQPYQGFIQSSNYVSGIPGATQSPVFSSVSPKRVFMALL